MLMQIKNITVVVAPQSAQLPDGKYTGKWGAYVVTVEHDGKTYNVEVDQGIRTMAAPVILTISDNGRRAEISLD